MFILRGLVAATSGESASSMHSLLLAAAVSTQAYTPMAMGVAGQRSQISLRRARAPVSLDKQEVLEKLNAVPVFAVANGAGQLMSTVSEFAETAAPVITFYLDIADAKASLAFATADDPSAGVQLTVAPLGKAFTMKSSDVTVQLQPSQAEYNSIRADLGFSSADESEGTMQLIPLFYSDELKFESASDPENPSTPFFFGLGDYRAAWVASGLAADKLPAVQLMDLRKLAYQMENDASDAWRSSVLIPSEAGIEFIEARG